MPNVINISDIHNLYNIFEYDDIKSADEFIINFNDTYAFYIKGLMMIDIKNANVIFFTDKLSNIEVEEYELYSDLRNIAYKIKMQSYNIKIIDIRNIIEKIMDTNKFNIDFNYNKMTLFTQQRTSSNTINLISNIKYSNLDMSNLKSELNRCISEFKQATILFEKQRYVNITNLGLLLNSDEFKSLNLNDIECLDRMAYMSYDDLPTQIDHFKMVFNKFHNHGYEDKILKIKPFIVKNIKVRPKQFGRNHGDVTTLILSYENILDYTYNKFHDSKIQFVVKFLIANNAYSDLIARLNTLMIKSI